MPLDKIWVDANRLWDEGYEQDAFQLFLHGAKMNVVDCYNSIGYMLDHGIGVDRDTEKAFFWYRKAARNGYKGAYSNVGLCYIAIGKSEIGIRWLIKAIKNGYHDTGIDLAKILITENKKN
jgi:TPR repeat protein